MNSSSVLRRRAEKLRQSGQSFRDISKKLNISVSTSHLWTRAIRLTIKQKTALRLRQQISFQYGRKIASKFKRTKKIKEEKAIVQLAKTEFQRMKNDPLFILGISLYWGEGFKKDHSLGFVNSDVQMVRIFLHWLSYYCQIEKENLRVRIQINEVYKPQIENIQDFWSTQLKIPRKQFQTPFFQKSKNTSIVDLNYQGQIRIRAIGSRHAFLKILTWIDELKEHY